jgi:hypothetical protein
MLLSRSAGANGSIKYYTIKLQKLKRTAGLLSLSRGRTGFATAFIRKVQTLFKCIFTVQLLYSVMKKRGRENEDF